MSFPYKPVPSSIDNVARQRDDFKSAVNKIVSYNLVLNFGHQPVYRATLSNIQWPHISFFADDRNWGLVLNYLPLARVRGEQPQINTPVGILPVHRMVK